MKVNLERSMLLIMTETAYKEEEKKRRPTIIGNCICLSSKIILMFCLADGLYAVICSW